LKKFSKSDIANFNSLQIVELLSHIRQNSPNISLDAIKSLNSLYEISSMKNSEIRKEFYLIAINCWYEEMFPHIENFLKEQGRMKYVRPIYRALFNSPNENGKVLSLQFYSEFKSNYHSICNAQLIKDLKIKEI